MTSCRRRCLLREKHSLTRYAAAWHCSRAVRSATPPCIATRGNWACVTIFVIPSDAVVTVRVNPVASPIVARPTNAPRSWLRAVASVTGKPIPYDLPEARACWSPWSKSQRLCADRMEPDGTAEAMAWSIVGRLERIKRLVHTVTCDRGGEFTGDRAVEKQLKARVYFADPHSPWQRGCNENFNGLLRQFFPRKCDFSTITAQELQQVEDQLNNRPRKRLGYLTPSEVFFNHDHVALQS